jgi:DNA-binding response OmpR family regulator
MKFGVVMQVLLISDDPRFRTAMRSVAVIADAVESVSLAAAGHDHASADVALIDVCGDLAAARDACHRLSTHDTPMAVVAVLSEADFVAVGLDWGFDDVVQRNAGVAELHARLRLAMARRHSHDHEALRFGDLVLHPESYTASLHGRKLDLTLTEFKLLNYLMHHAGQAISRKQLMHEVWGYDCTGRPRTVDVHVQRLRAKLGGEYESLVDTVRGVGYMAAVPTDPSTPTAA